MRKESEHRTGTSRPPATSPPPAPSAAASAASFLGVGLQFAVAILLGLYLGQWVDGRFATEPWGLLAGVFIGAGTGFYGIYRKLMADLRRDEERRAR